MNKWVSLRLSNGLVLEGKVIYQTCSKALEAIENELPEEARCFETYLRILQYCEEFLKEKKIVL